MIRRFKLLISNNRLVIENFSFLSILQVINLIIFFLITPFLFRILGKTQYGLVVFAQNITTYFSILINYGFNATATRDISINRENPKERSMIVSSTIVLKFLFFGFSLMLMTIFVMFIPFFKSHPLLFYFSMLYCLSEALFPIWYFQGIEKMKFITYINVVVRTISALSIFFIISDSSEYYLVPLVLGSGSLAGALIGLIIVFFYYGNYFILQNSGTLKRLILINFPLFISNVSSQIYVNANKLFIGSFMGMQQLAIYDIADRIVNLIKVPLSIIGQVLFPKVARDGNLNYIKKTMIISVSGYILIYLVLFAFTGILVHLIAGSYNQEIILIVRILGLSVIPICAGLFYADLRLLAFGFLKDYTRMRTASLFIYTLLLIILYAFNYTGLNQLAIVIIIVELFVLIYSKYLCSIHKLTVS